MMNGNDHITVDTELQWDFGMNDVQLYYESNYKGEKISLIRNEQEYKWFAMFNSSERSKLLPLQAEKVVNELVLQVEDYLKKND